MNSVLSYVRHSSDEVFGFFGEFGFLSLQFPVTIQLNGLEFPSALNAFHASKCPDPYHVRLFCDCDPLVANEKSKGLPVFRDWKQKRDKVIEQILVQKFKDESLKDLLLETNFKKLVNANHWGDLYWGVDQNGNGENKLGKILEQIRADIIEKEKEQEKEQQKEHKKQQNLKTNKKFFKR